MEMQIRDRIGHDLLPNEEGNYYTGREVLRDGEWVPEYFGDATCEIPTTESHDEFYERFCESDAFIRTMVRDGLPFDKDGCHATGREVLTWLPDFGETNLRRTGWGYEYENDWSVGSPTNEPEEVFNFRQDEYYFGED